MRRALLTALGSFVLWGLPIGCSGDESEAPPAPEVSHDPFAPVPEDVLREQVQGALARARAGNKKVLLDFVADWCEDCREVVRVSSLGPAAQVIADEYEVVHVEVGRFDRHVELIRRYRIERIATLVVLDAQGERIAQTTLEPISNRRMLTPEALAAWLREPVDHWSGEGRHEEAEDETPVFPPEIVDP